MIKKKSIPKITEKDVKKNIEKANAASKFLSKNKYLLGAIGVGVVGYLVYSKISKGIDSIGSGVSDVFTGEQETIDVDAQVDTTNLSITDEDAQKYASQLLSAFNHTTFGFWGTDEETVKAVFSALKTADDFKLVYKVFDLKNYNGYNSPPTGITKILDNYEAKDLVYWLQAEISSSDGEVYDIVKQVVESAGWIF